MKRHTRGTVAGLAFLALALTAGARAEPADQGNSEGLLPLDRAVALAVADNPSLAQVQSRYHAMAEMPSQLGVLPDPELSLTALNFPTDSFEYRQEPMTQLQIGISQRFPFPGKLALMQRASRFEADAARDNVDETRLRLIRDVRSSWWAIHYFDRALELVEQNKALLRQFIDVAQVKYEVGDGLQQDVLLAQLELSKMLDRELQLGGMRSAETARLGQLIDRPAAPVRLPKIDAGSLPEPESEASLFARAERHRPYLAQLENRIEAAESRLALAEKDRYPDFTLGAVYGFRGGDNPPPGSGGRADLVTVRLSVNLPLYPDLKRGSAVSQRTNELLSERYALEDATSGVYAEIARARADYVLARDQFTLFATGIVPQARLTVQSMLGAYQVSEVDFLNLVRSQVTLFDYETQYWRALSAAHEALARLRAAVGEEVIR